MPPRRALVLPCAWEDNGNFAVSKIPDYKREVKASLVPDGGQVPPCLRLVCSLKSVGSNGL